MSEPNATHESHVLFPRGRALLGRYLLLTGAAFLFLVPMFWMASSSLKPEYQIFANPPVWWPAEPRWANYVEALTQLPFGRFAANTLIIAIGSIVGNLLSCTLVAIYFFGGSTLQNFAFALLVGITSGAYSSVFVAAPTLVIIDKYFKSAPKAQVSYTATTAEVDPVYQETGTDDGPKRRRTRGQRRRL